MLDDYEDEEEYSPDDESETLPCPHCGADVYEEAEQCPACGTYITFSNHPFHGRSFAWIVLGVLGVVALIWMSVFAWS